MGKTQQKDDLTAIDPVCGMSVKLNTDKPSLVYKEQDYHFCSPKCHDRFEADPFFYLSGSNKRQKIKVALNTQYTCPMDPEIIQDEPGNCSICGMALEPMAGVSDEPNHELIDFTRRFWVCVGLGISLLILSMGQLVGIPLRSWLGETNATYLEFLLATPVVVWAAQPFFKRGWTSLKTANFNMWTLIMLGVSAAYAYSVIATFLPSLFPLQLQQNDSVPVYYETSVVIIALIFLGQIMELRARERTGDAIRSLLDLAPKTALRINVDGSEYEAPLGNILEGDHLRIRPGESIPVDGVVIEGRSSIDESMLSGEPIPVEKTIGAELTSGTINKSGSLVMKAHRVGSETRLSQIVEMVSSAQRSRAPIQSLADKVASWFVPLVVVIAIVAFIAWLILGPEPSLVYAVISAVSVLIIACPCALGLATPMSIMTASGKGAQSGVLIRDARALEKMAEVDCLIVDKTGTLTQGLPVISDINTHGKMGEDNLLKLVGSLEKASEHPLAGAILSEVEARGLKLSKVMKFSAEIGKGLSGNISDKNVTLGNAAMMATVGLKPNSFGGSFEELLGQGKTVIMVAVDRKPAGIIAVSDPVKSGAKSSVSSLKEMGLKIIMASGDNERTARYVAKQLGIDDVKAGLLPEEKLDLIRKLQSDGFKVAMAGDGVNDAPALAGADVGIAMGTGADVALESAGITLLKGDLNGILRARKLAIATMKNIKQNLFFAFAYNGIGVPIAAGILYPITGLLLSPMIAAAAMSLSSVSVITNALRLRNLNLVNRSGV